MRVLINGMVMILMDRVLSLELKGKILLYKLFPISRKSFPRHNYPSNITTEYYSNTYVFEDMRFILHDYMRSYIHVWIHSPPRI